MNNQQTDCERDTTPQALLSIDEALELKKALVFLDNPS
jgi:hypothetical protein